MTEQKLQSKVIDYINTIGYCVKIIVASKSGTPDIIACINGKFVAVECKSEIGKLSPIQEYRKMIIEQNKGLHFIVNPNNFGFLKKELDLLK